MKTATTVIAIAASATALASIALTSGDRLLLNAYAARGLAAAPLPTASTLAEAAPPLVHDAVLAGTPAPALNP